jgi:drug/metabolite transporter (DMT)-like permease
MRSSNQITYIYLWTATIVFAASSALTRKLNLIGQTHLMDGRNPISLCNVLFVGNLCALGVMVCLFRKDWQWEKLKSISPKDWMSLCLIGSLSGALGPALIFDALGHTTVTNVVILGRLEPPMSLALAILLLGVRINRYTFLGAIVSSLGVMVTALLSPNVAMMMEFHLGRGEVMVGAAAVVLAIANILSRVYLKTVALGVFAVMRNVIGTIIFFCIAQVLYGPHHFMDVFSPFLWKWMVIYSLVIVVVGQLCSFSAQKMSTLAQSTLVNGFQPLLAIAMAFFILGEVPMMAQFVGGGILLLGIGLSTLGVLHDAQSPRKMLGKITVANANMGSDYRGV